MNMLRLVKKVVFKPYWLLAPHMEKMVATPREKERSLREKKLQNRDFTILSNNCAAGVIYHDVKHRFDSPTINLFMSDEDFFEFLYHLDAYLSQKPQEVFLEKISYPVGVLSREDKQITLHFMHYQSFSQACEKWQERSARVHKDNLYIIFNHANPVTNENEIAKKFLALPYPNKVMLTHYKNEPQPSPDIHHMRLYEKARRPGQLFEYRAPYSIRRYLEEFDYVAFLNQKH